MTRTTHNRIQRFMNLFGKQPAPQILAKLPLAGFRHYRGEALWDFLRAGETVQLKRHPQNRHDKRAVAVYWRRNLIGYLPRARNRGISDLLDIGEPLCGTIEELKAGGDPWNRVRITVCRSTE